MLTPHAVAELTDPSSGLEQQLLRNQVEDLRREYALVRHVSLQTTTGLAGETAQGLDVLSDMVGECLGSYARQVSAIAFYRPFFSQLAKLTGLGFADDTALACLRSARGRL